MDSAILTELLERQITFLLNNSHSFKVNHKDIERLKQKINDNPNYERINNLLHCLAKTVQKENNQEQANVN